MILTTKSSKESRIALKCDLGGEYKIKKASTTNSGSRLTNCDYEIICSKKKGVCGIRKEIGTHNHAISLDVSGHSVARRPSKTEKETIRKSGESGIAPKAILNQLNKDGANTLITAKEVYRELDNQKKDFLGERQIWKPC